MSIQTKLSFLIGCSLLGTENGIGSLNTIILSRSNHKKYFLWLYMADWAFVDKADEIASSDIPDIGRKLNLKPYYGTTLTDIYIFEDDAEIHFEFENGFRLEIWENAEAYGTDNRKFFSIFAGESQRKHILSYPF